MVSIHREPQPNYRWVCGMCDGMDLVESIEGDGELVGCYKCSLALEYGVVYEMVKRNVTPCASGRLASPAVQATRFVYEVWEHRPDKGVARLAACESDSGSAYAEKWKLEDEAYGTVGA